MVMPLGRKLVLLTMQQFNETTSWLKVREVSILQKDKQSPCTACCGTLLKKS